MTKPKTAPTDSDIVESPTMPPVVLEQPRAGGSYVRQPDGTLKKKGR